MESWYSAGGGAVMAYTPVTHTRHPSLRSREVVPHARHTRTRTRTRKIPVSIIVRVSYTHTHASPCDALCRGGRHKRMRHAAKGRRGGRKGGGSNRLVSHTHGPPAWRNGSTRARGEPCTKANEFHNFTVECIIFLIQFS